MALLVSALMIMVPAVSAQSSVPPVWVTTFDPGDLDLGEGVAVDGFGNVLVTGIAENADQQDAVTVKLDPDGEVVWTQVIDRGPRDRGDAVAADAEGNAYVAATVQSAGGDNVLVVKYNATGSVAWVLTLDKGTSEAARGISLAPDGSLFVTGVSLSQNGGDGFLLKVSPDGEEEWAKAINLFFLDETFDVDVDEDGDPVVSGRVLRDGRFDAMTRKYASDGTVEWTRYLRTDAAEEGRGVATDADGHVYVSGTRDVRTDGVTQKDVLVAKYTPDGEAVWEKTLDLSGDDDEGRDAFVDPSGALFVTGFGNFSNGKDPFLLKLTGDGDVVWRHVWHGDGIDGTGAIAGSFDGRYIVSAGAMQDVGRDFDYLALKYDQQPPDAAFRPSARVTTAGAAVAFEDASAPGRVPITHWTWDFGDGETSTTQNPLHTFAEAGEHLVTLTVRDAHHNVATETLTLTVTSADGTLPGATDTSGPDGDDPSESQLQNNGLLVLALVVTAAVVTAGAVVARGRRKAR